MTKNDSYGLTSMEGVSSVTFLFRGCLGAHTGPSIGKFRVGGSGGGRAFNLMQTKEKTEILYLKVSVWCTKSLSTVF